MEKGDSPEIDQSEALGPDGVTLYQSLIGALQWAVTLGRLDILVAVMFMSHFRINPSISFFGKAQTSLWILEERT
jgi:hypothetical protein